MDCTDRAYFLFTNMHYCVFYVYFNWAKNLKKILIKFLTHAETIIIE